MYNFGTINEWSTYAWSEIYTTIHKTYFEKNVIYDIAPSVKYTDFIFSWVIQTIPLKKCPRYNATQITTTIHYDWALLNNKDIRDKYVIALRNKIDALQEKT